MTVSGLPPIDPTFEPASVRNGSPALQKAYASALDFESMLVQQLSQSLSETSGLGGEGESESGRQGGSEGGASDPGQRTALLAVAADAHQQRHESRWARHGSAADGHFVARRASEGQPERRCEGVSVLLAPSEQETLTGAVLAHLDAQVESAARLLEVVLQQGVAIRARDVHAVVRFAGLLHGEMSRREAIEPERSRLLEQSGALLGIAPEAVTLTRLATLMDPARAELASARSAQLRGLLA